MKHPGFCHRENQQSLVPQDEPEGGAASLPFFGFWTNELLGG